MPPETIAHLPPAQARAIHTVFTDIDDTLTSDGRLPAVAYTALEQLQQAGLRVIPVTGRPAGWCDHIARMWPVDAVIGENGAFYLWRRASDGHLAARHLLTPPERAALEARLIAVREQVLRAVPGCALASDQFCRLYDLAIDYREDVPPLPMAEAERIAGLMRAAGMHAKISSIHVNGWFGDWDKLSTARLLLQERYGLALEAERERIVFAGDSPNDEPMFACFPHAVGVANVLDFAAQLRHLPRWITPSRGGAGFAELARHLLAAHAG